MNKKVFEKLDVEIIFFGEEDVVRTSENLIPGDGDIDWGDDD